MKPRGHIWSLPRKVVPGLKGVWESGPRARLRLAPEGGSGCPSSFCRAPDLEARWGLRTGPLTRLTLGARALQSPLPMSPGGSGPEFSCLSPACPFRRGDLEGDSSLAGWG